MVMFNAPYLSEGNQLSCGSIGKATLDQKEQGHNTY
jgi:hypothetical protein